MTFPPTPSSSSPPPSHPTALLATSPPSTPADLITTLTTLTTQASSHLLAASSPTDFYESALTLMHVLQTIELATDRIIADDSDAVLTMGVFGGRKILDVLAAQMLSINIQICRAFAELGMWELVGARVGDAGKLVDMSRGHFHVSGEAREWLGKMGEIADEQGRIDEEQAAAVDG